MGLKVKTKDDGTFLGTDLPDDGSLAVVTEWPNRWNIGSIVVRDRDCLIFLGQHRDCWLPIFFSRVWTGTTGVRLRLLKPGEPLENSDS